MLKLDDESECYPSGIREWGKATIVFGIELHLSKIAPQPMSEEALLTSKLEPTYEPYAIAKIAGIKMCEKATTANMVNRIVLIIDPLCLPIYMGLAIIIIQKIAMIFWL